MNPISPKVAVVLVNWERSQDTLECIESVLSSDISLIQVIVVDNGSMDQSREHIKQRFPQVNLISLPENVGFAGGYNKGIQEALKGIATHIFIINDDAVVDSNTISQLLASNWDVAVPKILFYDNRNLVWSAGARWRAFPPSVKIIGFRKRDGSAYNIPYSLDYATACSLMISRLVFEKVGGFDQEFINYMEDYDFSYRLKQAGFTMGYVPLAKVFHKGSQTLGEYSPSRWKFQGRNTVFFYLKDDRFPRWKLWVFLTWTTAREILKGNFRILPKFWQGVIEGLHSLK
jgi:GT2 family glycosyltransferase